jgi:hypothetical protein
MRLLTPFALLAMTAACQYQAQPSKEVALPSGKKVRVLAVGQINFSNDSPALMLKYQTDLKVSNAVELRKEVDEIRPVFRTDVEHANLTNAIVSANEVPQGLVVKTANAMNFVYKRSADGDWHLVDDAEKASDKTAHTGTRGANLLRCV